MKAIKPNPGGNIDPEDVIGRDEIISSMWRTLDGRSINLVSERRIGKTSLLRKMAAEPIDGWHGILILVEKGYRNEPLNDMETFTLGGLSDNDALKLTRALSAGCGITISEEAEKYICSSVDNIPFFIHSIMYQLDRKGIKEAEKEDIEKVVEEIILDPVDRASIEHYEGRIYTHYPAEMQDAAFFILDTLSGEEGSQSFDVLWNDAKTQFEQIEKEKFRRVLNLLVKDHYLKMTDTGGGVVYGFNYSLIKRWWRKRRG